MLILCIAIVLPGCRANKIYISELELFEKDISSASLWYNGVLIELNREEITNVIDILSSMVYEKRRLAEIKEPGAVSVYVTFTYSDGKEQKISYPYFRHGGKVYKTERVPSFGSFVDKIYTGYKGAEG